MSLNLPSTPSEHNGLRWPASCCFHLEPPAAPGSSSRLLRAVTGQCIYAPSSPQSFIWSLWPFFNFWLLTGICSERSRYLAFSVNLRAWRIRCPILSWHLKLTVTSQFFTLHCPWKRHFQNISHKKASSLSLKGRARCRECRGTI